VGPTTELKRANGDPDQILEMAGIFVSIQCDPACKSMSVISDLAHVLSIPMDIPRVDRLGEVE